MSAVIGVVHLKRSWGDDSSACGPIGPWSEAVLAAEIVTCKRCKRIIEAEKSA